MAMTEEEYRAQKDKEASAIGSVTADDLEAGREAPWSIDTQGIKDDYEGVAQSALDTTPDYSGAQYEGQAVQEDVSALDPTRSGVSYLEEDGGELATVQGQLDQLLAKDSPLFTAAENKARTISQATGRAASGTMSAGGAMAAVLGEAIPIATTDAATYGTFLGREQEADYYKDKIQAEGIVSSAMNEHKAGLDAANAQVTNAFNARISGANQASAAILQESNAKWNNFTQTSLKELDTALQLKLQSNEISQQNYNTSLLSASYIMQNAGTNIANMMTDPVILDTDDPQTVANTLNNYISSVQSSVNLMGGLANASSTFSRFSDAWANASFFGTEEIVQTATGE